MNRRGSGRGTPALERVGSDRARRTARWSEALAAGLLAIITLGVVDVVGQEPATPDPVVRAPVLDSVFEVDGVLVSVASRLAGDARTRAITVLDRPALESLSATTVSEALRWAVGVDLQPRSLAQADVAVRGGTFEQVVVLVDGVPMSDAQTGHFDLDVVVPLSGVERIEVLRGAASAVHGADAMGGVINIVTRGVRPGRRGVVDLEAGDWGRAAGAVRLEAGLGDRWSLAASARLDRSDGHRDGTDHDMRLADARIRGAWAGAFWRCVSAAPRATSAPTASTRPSPRTSRPAQAPSRRGGVESRVRSWSTSRFTGEPTTTTSFFGEGIPPSTATCTSRSRRGWISRCGRPPGPGPGQWGLRGARCAREHRPRHTLGRSWSRLRRNRLAGRGRTGHRRPATRRPGGLRTDLGALAVGGLDGVPPDRAPGRRWEVVSCADLDRPVLRGSGEWGDPDLAVETAWSGELGVDLSPTFGGLLRVTTFVREARDLIDYARPSDGPDDAVWQTRNVESATFRGIEIEIGGVRVGRLDLDGALELLDVESDETGAFVSKYALRPLTRSAVVGARLPFGGRFAAALRIENRRRTGEVDRTAADLRVEAHIGRSRLWVDATNLGDARWLDVSGMPAPGRSLRTGVSVEFGG